MPESTIPPAIDFDEIGTDEQIAALYGALAMARLEFGKIAKNRTVKIASQKGNYTFDYADLETSLDATVPALAKHGLVVLQPTTTQVVRTILAHKGGGRIQSCMSLPEATDIKGFGANITYLRRYSYNAMLCLSADADLDDVPETKRGETGAVATPRAKEPAKSAAPMGQAAPLASFKSEPPAAPITAEQKDKMRGLLRELGATNAPGANEICKRLVGLTLSEVTTEALAHDLIIKLGNEGIRMKQEQP